MATLRRHGTRMITIGVIVLVIAGIVIWRVSASSGYQVTVIFPEATDLGTGSLVQVNGFPVGKVSHLGVSDGQALVQVTLNSKNAPLHSGTHATIDYKSLLGERYVEIQPGPTANPKVPNGGIIPGGEDRVELAQILSALDPQTLDHLASVIPQLKDVLSPGNNNNVNQTIAAAGPTVQALAQVLDAVGQNGLALKQLVSSMSALSTRLVNRQGSLVNFIQGFDQAYGAISTQDQALQTGFQQLPATLNHATSTLAELPPTVANVVPLLNDLAPGAAALPSFAADLHPVVTELSPVINQLQPTLGSLNYLLKYTPALANTANGTLPGLTQALSTLEKPQQLTLTTSQKVTTSPLDFLRPYTPEFSNWMTGWANWLANYNTSGSGSPGHFGAFTVKATQPGNPAAPGAFMLGVPQTNDGIPNLPSAQLGGADNCAGTPAGIPQDSAFCPPYPGNVAGVGTPNAYQLTDAAGNPIQ